MDFQATAGVMSLAIEAAPQLLAFKFDRIRIRCVYVAHLESVGNVLGSIAAIWSHKKA
jgi:hypothetical protein